MRNSLAIKFLAVLLCTLALLGVGASVVGLGALASAGMLDGKTAADIEEEDLRNRAAWVAESAVNSWASNTLGGVPKEVTDTWMAAQNGFFRDGTVFYSIEQKNEEVASNYDGEAYAHKYTFQIDGTYYQKAVTAEPTAEDTGEEADLPAEYAEPRQEIFSGGTPEPPVEVTEAVAEVPDFPAACAEPRESVFSAEASLADGSVYEYDYVTQLAPQCQVTVYLTEDAVPKNADLKLLETVSGYRNTLIGVLIGCGLLFAGMAVYLCSSAGHKPGTTEIRPAGLNTIPLDVYGVMVICYLVVCVLILDETARSLYNLGLNVFLFCLGLMAFFGCLIFVGFCFACAAQFKVQGHYWLRNSLTGRCCILAWRLCGWLLPGLWKAVNWCRKLVVGILTFVFGLLYKGMSRLGRGLEHFFRLLPLTWQWILAGGILTVLIVAAFAPPVHFLSFVVCMGLAGAMIVYGAQSFGILLEAAKKMRQGELNTKVDDRLLVGGFRDFAGELNGLADVAVVAAQKQLKSERMKTELITNVSHDIKTPLTSIINYVDLLQKPHTSVEEQTYLEVLSRQSNSLKKLIEDLIEMSKATTGNIPVELVQMDAVEAVNQALGEYSGKLERAGLTPVFRHEQGSVMMQADGRLVWRVLSNLLSNAVKYAMPGTRIYVDVTEMDNTVVLSVKNISHSELNISADELMERFVRGDTARNTEGSGLGLNIAKSLMELQHGQLELLVDGDLFKVTLVFPK